MSLKQQVIGKHFMQKLSQTEASKKLPLKRYLQLLKRYLRPQWQKASFMFLLLLSSIGLQLLVPQVARFFIDSVLEGSATKVLIHTALVFLGVAIFYQLLSAAATYVASDVGWTATNKIRLDLVRHCLKLDMGFHNTRTSGELIERIDGDVTALANFFSQFTVRILGSLLMLLGILVLLFFEHMYVGLAISMFTIFAFITVNNQREIAVPASKVEREASAKLFGFIEERLAGIDDVRANGAGRYNMLKLQGVSLEYFQKSVHAWMMRLRIWILSYGLFIIVNLITLGLAIYLFQQGQISLGAAYLLFQYMLMLEVPIEEVTQQLQEMQKAVASIGRIDDLFKIQSTLGKDQELSLPCGALSLKFDKVSFAYNNKTVLENISFELSPNKTLGLLGRTGSGKTTLSRLIFRFYDVSEGSVSLSGLDIQKIGMSELHSRVGLVTQEVQLFHATIRDNLTFFDDSVSDTEILQVLADLGLNEWLKDLPQGLDTVVAAGGKSLSAGEAQLLAFARVFLKDPSLVILDEFSSRLDPTTETLLEKAVDKLLVGRTAIIVAHRLKAVARADEILILRNRHILEHGPRIVLANNPNSHFYELLKTTKDLDMQ